METRAYRLRLRGPLHVGERSIGLETALDYVPSDTLFSALVVALSRIPQHREAIDGLGAAFADTIPLMLSSAFPYVGDTLLLPRPRVELLPAQRGETNVSKEAKRVRWVSFKLFQRLLDGIDQADLDTLWHDGRRVQHGAVWLAPGEVDQFGPGLDGMSELTFWEYAREPKVTIDRMQNASQIFHMGRVHFRPDAGLWCLARGEAAWLALVDQGLAVLGDNGLGGKRSQGNGQYDLAPFAPPALFGQVPTEPDGYAVLLSRLSPTPDQIDLLQRPAASYELVSVGGYVGSMDASSLIRKQVRLVAEGSIIGAGAAVPGRLVDVTPAEAPQLTHPIYRYGIGFAVPIQLSPGNAP